MAAIGNFPFYDQPATTRPLTLTTTASFGSVLMADATDSPDSAKKTTGAGVTGIVGVVNNSQGDPNNSGLFPVSSVVDAAIGGIVPVLFAAATVLTREATIISGATAGTAKVLASETAPYDVIGYYAGEAKTIGASPDVGSVRLDIHRVEA